MAQKYPALITMFHIFGVRQAQKLSALDAEASDARVGKLGFFWGPSVLLHVFVVGSLVGVTTLFKQNRKTTWF